MSLRITALTDPEYRSGGHRLAWLASDDTGVPLGSAFLRLPGSSGQAHLAELDLAVHPAERRRGAGSRLLTAAVAAARADGRRCVTAQTDADSPGDQFLAARGFRRVLTLIHTRLPLARLDTAALAEIAGGSCPGYRLEFWDGVVPDALAATFAASRRAMDDMPMDDADFGTVEWDVERVRSVARAVETRGDRLHTVAAVSVTDGTVVAFTELVVPGDGTGDGRHYGTGVLPEHRGHGLGRWMKAAAILRARAVYPALGGLLTDTAAGNVPMRAINEALGYRPTHTALMYQLDLR
ncbi:GNAT family N-acetyltransferase [Actinacidiphila acidipaludis]|uniref:GNAT family N-acetyltransferase n=1 Tax=Actinacidiphila acidipaludis TaxID=2873382 RepID=A0ABS7QGL5_9ACTN|nr:GNAT family N-acetyltransferase [Streptomyces acidipaludis]MBY8882295.1 GNAT family N-acetyltransferase [Streptomyces acidipaludis]